MGNSGDGSGGRARIPTFGGDKSYDRWKQELEAWQLVTRVEKKKQAVTVTLAFPEGSEVRDKVFAEMKIADLAMDNGVSVLLQHLDKWYKKDEMSAAYEAWTRFNNYRKEKEDTMERYILEFVKRWTVLEKYRVSISKSILAFKLLDSAGLNVKDKQIVLTAVSFSEPDKMLDSMEAALKKYFGSQEVLSLGTASRECVVVKTEPVFNTKEVSVVTRARGRAGFRGGRGRDIFVKRNEKSGQKKFADKYGNVKKCYVCGSEYHLSPAYPRNVYVNSASEEEHKAAESYAVVESPGMISVLMTESISYAILDTACSSTVCGTDWMKSYIQTLSEEEKSRIVEEESGTTFRFGDGNVYKSMKKVKFPVNIIGDRVYVTADVCNR